MLHIYYGNGKGKTCSAVGAAVRAAGSGMKVLFVQLFKSDKSSERTALSALDNINVYPCPEKLKFTFQMNDDELALEKERYKALLADVKERCVNFDMIIIDEFFTLYDCGFFDSDFLYSFITSIYKEKELILTAHGLDRRFIELADYATHFECISHPYNNGISPRCGIEF